MAVHRKKTCSACGRVLSIRAFYHAGAGGRAHLCRQCARRERVERYWRNIEIERLRARVYRANQRAAAWQRPGRLTLDDLLTLLHLAGEHCMYCGADLVNGFEIDHRIPLSKPGSMNTIANIAITCPPCNRTKQVQPFTEFLARRKALQAA